MSRLRIPFLQPRPPRLSGLVRELESIERSGIHSNFGPVNTRFEAAMTERLFGGHGGCLTVANATIGLMLAIREAATPGEGRRFALMPSFTFAATAQAALWAGLTPLLCDIDPESWNACPAAEERLLRQHAGQIACLLPYACFGNGLDLDRYAHLAQVHGTGLVVDAAASLGVQDAAGQGFGMGFPHAVVYSMHATKTFATAEAGLLHCGDLERLGRLRSMANFGFGRPREATMPGLNAKLSEVGALLGLARLEGFEAVLGHRALLATAYREQLPGFVFQRSLCRRQAYQFMPALLPEDSPLPRAGVLAALAAKGIGAAHYFSPHLAEQPYFADTCEAGELDVTAQIAARILSLPMSDEMNLAEVAEVCRVLRDCTGRSA